MPFLLSDDLHIVSDTPNTDYTALKLGYRYNRSKYSQPPAIGWKIFGIHWYPTMTKIKKHVIFSTLLHIHAHDTIAPLWYPLCTTLS